MDWVGVGLAWGWASIETSASGWFSADRALEANTHVTTDGL